MEFNDLHDSENIYLYAGDLPEGNRENVPFIGLTLKPEAEWWNEFHINHDVTAMIDLPDNSVDIFQSEDVFEHIEYDQLKSTINEIYRVLKPGGLFRLSMPDYRCDILNERSKRIKMAILFLIWVVVASTTEERKRLLVEGMFGSQSTKQLGLYWKVQNLPISIFCTITTPMELQSSTK